MKIDKEIVEQVNQIWKDKYPNGRDPKRIKRILNKIEKIWENYPDFRLSQIICNSISESQKDNLFHLEDDKLEFGIDELAKKVNLPNGWKS